MRSQAGAPAPSEYDMSPASGTPGSDEKVSGEKMKEKGSETRATGGSCELMGK